MKLRVGMEFELHGKCRIMNIQGDQVRIDPLVKCKGKWISLLRDTDSFPVLSSKAIRAYLEKET